MSTENNKGMPRKPPIAAIYVRVSTDKQELDNQIATLTSFCERSGWDVFKIYEDFGISGKEESRPAFDQLFLDAHKKLFSILLFWDLSRFSRAGMEHTVIKLMKLREEGVSWHSYQEPYLTTTGSPMVRDIVLACLSSLAKVQREQISRNTKAGMERVRKYGSKSGKPIGRPEAILNVRLRIRELVDAGKTKPEISKILGIPRGSVHYYIKKMDG